MNNTYAVFNNFGSMVMYTVSEVPSYAVDKLIWNKDNLTWFGHPKHDWYYYIQLGYRVKRITIFEHEEVRA